MQNHFTQLQDHYRAWLDTLGFSPGVVYSYPKMLYHLFDYLQTKGVYHITALRASHITDYFEHLQTRPNMRLSSKALSKSHLNKSFDSIDKFLEFLHQRGMSSAPQPTRYRIMETRSEVMNKVKIFTRQEIQTLYHSAQKLFTTYLAYKDTEPRQAIAILILDLCYGCGLRKSEAFNLLIEDIDPDRKILFVRQAKGYKDRYVPISQAVNKRIKVFIYQHRRAFNTQSKRLFPLSFHALPCYFKLLLKSSGLQYQRGTGLHTLRHSIATHLLQNGMSIEQIARFLGHGTLESTQVYTHLISDDAQ